MAILDFLGRAFRRRAKPTAWEGAPGFSVYAGIVDTPERDRQLADHDEQHKTYSTILANTSIVAASVRYYLSLIGKSEWTFEPSESDTSGEFAERLESILMDDMMTPWHRVVRRAAMYRFYGFSVQEWRAKRHEDGYLTFADIRPRPQATIERWDTDEDGIVLGMIQQRPQDSQYLYIPRNKTLYLVDDSLSDAPTGLGIFRHLVAPAERLRRYEQLEGFGFEVDLRNIPIGRAPIAKLMESVQNGDLTQQDVDKILEPIKNFIRNHVRNPQLGMLIDSQPYESSDDAQSPSSTSMYGLDLLTGGQSSLPQSAMAIERLNREIARIMGTEQLLLGENTGSYALSQDKTGQFYLLIDSALTEIREAVKDDIVKLIWQLNGWPDDMMPEIRTEAVRARDVEQISMALREMATAGAPLMPDDPVVNQVRDLLGVERQPEESLYQQILDSMEPPEDGPSDDDGDEDEMPEDEE